MSTLLNASCNLVFEKISITSSPPGANKQSYLCLGKKLSLYVWLCCISKPLLHIVKINLTGIDVLKGRGGECQSALTLSVFRIRVWAGRMTPGAGGTTLSCPTSTREVRRLTFCNDNVMMWVMWSGGDMGGVGQPLTITQQDSLHQASPNNSVFTLLRLKCQVGSYVFFALEPNTKYEVILLYHISWFNAQNTLALWFCLFNVFRWDFRQGTVMDGACFQRISSLGLKNQLVLWRGEILLLLAPELEVIVQRSFLLRCQAKIMLVRRRYH